MSATVVVGVQAGVAIGLGVVTGARYLAQPDRLTTSLFSGAVRILLWYAGMAGQMAALGPGQRDTLEQAAHTLQQWKSACDSAEDTRDAPAATESSHTSSAMQTIAGSPDVVPALQCWTGSVSPGQVGPSTILRVAIAGAALALAMAALAAHKTFAGRLHPVFTVLPVAVYMQLLHPALVTAARVSSPPPVGAWDPLGPVAIVWTPGLVHVLAGTLGVAALARTLASPGVKRTAPSPAAFCSKGYRRQLSPADARAAVLARLSAPSSAKPVHPTVATLADMAADAAAQDQAACASCGSVLPTHAFATVHTAELIAMLACVWLSTDIWIRLSCGMAVVLAGATALALRRPWALSELNDLDTTAHLGVLAQGVAVALTTALPSMRAVVLLAVLVLHAAMVLSMLLVLCRGYSPAMRRGLVKVRTTLARTLPHLHMPPQTSPAAGSEEGDGIADIAHSAMPSILDIVTALLRRMLPGPPPASRPAAPATDLLSALQHMPHATTPAAALHTLSSSAAGLVAARPAPSLLQACTCSCSKSVRGKRALRAHDALFHADGSPAAVAAHAAASGTPHTNPLIGSSKSASPAEAGPKKAAPVMSRRLSSLHAGDGRVTYSGTSPRRHHTPLSGTGRSSQGIVSRRSLLRAQIAQYATVPTSSARPTSSGRRTRKAHYKRQAEGARARASFSPTAALAASPRPGDRPVE